MDKQWKVVDLLSATKEFLEKKGINASARLDAELLLAKTLDCRRIDLYVKFDQIIGEPQLSQFRELVRQRGEHRPVKQILGHAEFMSHDFEVTPDVLIPRPETETLVEHVLRKLGAGPKNIFDIGTGSGNIGLSLALALPQARVWASDISAPAVDVARRNVQRHNLADRVTLLEGDLFDPFQNLGLQGQVDCIASNPPYIAECEVADLMPDVAQYEPMVALVSGDRGMAHLRRILDEAPAFLRPGGFVALEVSPFTSERVRAAAEAAGVYENIQAAQDLQRVDRVLIASKKS